jgi:hypothetical protein
MNAPDPDRIIDLVDDGPGLGQQFPPDVDEYEAWRLDVRAADDLATLLLWAKLTLPAPVVGCGCLDRTCIRCQVDRIVAERGR